jgi:hypothetical protein
MKLLFACFVVVLVTWMSFSSIIRELRRGALTMLETHIMMSSLIFRLIHTLVLHLALLLVLCLISLMDLTITHIVLVHKRTTLWLNALVTTHILIVVIISYVVLVFLLEGLTLTLSLEIWMVHVFPIVVHVPLGQMVKCKGQRRPFQAAWLKFWIPALDSVWGSCDDRTTGMFGEAAMAKTWDVIPGFYAKTEYSSYA